jgi:hypothetical protein
MKNFTAPAVATSLVTISTSLFFAANFKALNFAYNTCMNKIYSGLICNFTDIVSSTSDLDGFQSAIVPLYTGVIENLLRLLGF